MQASLYVIDRRILEILELASDPETGELSDLGLASLEKLEMDRKEMASSLLKWRQERVQRHTAIGLEIERLKEMFDREQRRAERVKTWLLASMVARGESKMVLDIFSVTVCRNSVPTVTVAGDPKTLPHEWIEIRSEFVVNKKAILASWKEHPDCLPVGVTVTEGKHLRIQ